MGNPLGGPEVLRLRGGGKRARKANEDKFQEIEVMMNARPALIDGDSQQVTAALRVNPGDLGQWIDGLELGALKMIQQDIDSGAKTGNLDHLIRPFVRHINELRALEDSSSGQPFFVSTKLSMRR
jgi:hypothetical protein